ncbi:MAG: hypothetical protein B7Y44_01870 [Sphingomonadales bacterium 28-55-16]|nr:MAG: hypothetical protein B7Y44_01870 [Sphingomonadales bacterium 28-55-16]
MRRAARLLCIFLSTLALAAPLSAKERLGVYQGWAAFRDPASSRCYAIAAPEETVSRATRPAFISIGFWPRRGVTHQLYVRLSRDRAANSGVTLTAGGRRFTLRPAGGAVWALDRRMDLAIVVAMRSATSLSIEAIGRDGQSIVDAYSLRGAPSAIDAAALGCAGMKTNPLSN